MTTIEILRHGETSGGNIYRGITDQPLTIKGWQQMQNAIAEKKHWRKIISSPLLRCSDFASYLSKQLNIPIAFDKRLQEMNFGDWEGLSAEQINQQTPYELAQFWNDPVRYPPPNGEHLLSMQQRIIGAWNEIISYNKDTLVITHGGPIRIILCHINKIPLNKVLSLEVPLASFHTFSIPETCTD